MDQYLKKLGCGWFQILLPVIFSFGISAAAPFNYGIGFYLQVPDYTCVDAYGTTYSCSQEEICDGIDQGDSLTTLVDWDSDRTINNWIIKFDLLCEPSWKTSLPGFNFFLGWALTSFWLPKYSDLYGRKKIYLIGHVLDLCIYTTILFTSNFTIIIVCGLLLGMLSSIRISVGYNYLIEFFPTNRQTFIGSVWIVIDALMYTMMVIYFWKIGREWSTILGSLCITANILNIVATLIIPESPRFLYNAGRGAEAM